MVERITSLFSVDDDEIKVGEHSEWLTFHDGAHAAQLYVGSVVEQGSVA